MLEFTCTDSEIVDTPNTPEKSQELRVITHPLGKVAVWGHCFANEAELQVAAVRAIEGGNLNPLQHLPGAYTTALLTDEGLQVVADRTSQFPVYYGEINGETIVTSRPSRATESGVRPDSLGLGTYIFAPDVGSALMEKRSAIDGFVRLTPGYKLNNIEKELRSQPFDITSPNPDKTFKETAEELREALQAAVSQRFMLGRTITSDMSGGKDSSSLAFLAAREGLNNNEIVHAFTSFHPQFPDGDREYAEHFATLHPNIDLEAIAFINDAPGYYTGHDVPHAEEVTYQTNAQVWNAITSYYTHITHKGGELHLNGSGGDEILGAHPLYLADLLRDGQLYRFLHQGLAAARLGRVSPLQVWQKAAVAATASPQKAMARFAHELEHNSEAPYGWADALQLFTPPGHESAWLTKGMRRQMANFALGHSSDLHILGGEYGLADHVAWRGVQSAGENIATTQYYLRAAGFDISLQSPFLDKHVVDACLSLPSYMRADPYTFKKILTNALEGVIPSEVLARQSKGAYSSGSFASLQKSLPHYRSMLQNSRLADLGIIEPRAILESLDRSSLMPMFPIWTLGRIVCAEMWLEGLDNQPHASPPRNEQASVVQLSSSPDAIRLPSQQYEIPHYVHCVARPDGALALLNLKTNTYHPLNATAGLVLSTLAKTGDAKQCTESLSAAYPEVSQQQIFQDVLSCIQELTEARVIQSSKVFQPRSLISNSHANPIKDAEVRTALPIEKLHSKWSDRVLALGGLGINAVLGRLAPQARLSALHFIQDKWCTRDATQQEAERLLDATHTIGRIWIGRLACLEESYSTALAMGIKRRRVAWHKGIRFDPLEFHSWIEAEGHPVRTARVDTAEGYYSFFSGAK